MASLVVTDGGICRLIWGVGGVASAVNVYSFRGTATVAVTQALANTVGAAIKAAVTSQALAAQLHTSVTLMNVGLRSVNAGNLPEFLDSGAPVAGTATGDMLPPQVAYCVTLRTNNAGRRFRGRSYLFGFAESASGANGAASAAVQTAAVAFVNAVANSLSTSSIPMVVMSRPDPTANPPRVGLLTNISTIIGRDLVWDTQRRRAIPGI